MEDGESCCLRWRRRIRPTLIRRSASLSCRDTFSAPPPAADPPSVGFRCQIKPARTTETPDYVGISVKDASSSLETKSPLKVCLPRGASPALPPSRPRGTSRRRVHRSCGSGGAGAGAAGHPATAQEKTRPRRQYRLFFFDTPTCLGTIPLP